MDKWQAQDTFWNSFGIEFYDENTVPDDAVMPYGTYQAINGSLDGASIISASLWYRGNNWREISQKADEISQHIYKMPSAIKIDGGYMKVRLPDGTPFAQRMGEPSDSQVRRMLLSVEIEFLTAF